LQSTKSKALLVFKLDKRKYSVSVLKRFCRDFAITAVLFLLIFTDATFVFSDFVKSIIVLIVISYMLFEAVTFFKSWKHSDDSFLSLTDDKLVFNTKYSENSISYDDLKILNTVTSAGTVSEIRVKTKFGHVIKICNFFDMDILNESLKERINGVRVFDL
jgi:hypothetical protein